MKKNKMAKLSTEAKKKVVWKNKLDFSFFYKNGQNTGNKMKSL
jgi:hypothetical protein